ncbi:unnamed protein product [Zymoseptoria tritici ST99CH_1A5]|uniref:Uncharacterized protein n=1 Tax=Zymoseptoria tritici ST99CH_1A5 TaxID=1276529 RepID=A0A1Y6LUY3_ZYMTR|nr:unnamed protein product [Zymoseptoria tritici ST99CH_1A5]
MAAVHPAIGSHMMQSQPSPPISGVGALQRQPVDIPDDVRDAIRAYHKATADFTAMLIRVPHSTIHDTDNIHRDGLIAALASARRDLCRVDDNTHVTLLLRYKRSYVAAADARARFARRIPIDSHLITTIREAYFSRRTANEFYSSQAVGRDRTTEKHQELNEVFYQIAMRLRNSTPVTSQTLPSIDVTVTPAATPLLVAPTQEVSPSITPESNLENTPTQTEVDPTDLAAASLTVIAEEAHIDTEGGTVVPVEETVSSITQQPELEDDASTIHVDATTPPLLTDIPAGPQDSPPSTNDNITDVPASIPNPPTAADLSGLSTLSIAPLGAVIAPPDRLLEGPRAFLEECVPQFLITQLNTHPQLRGHLDTISAVLRHALPDLLRCRFGETSAVSECVEVVPSLLSENTVLEATTHSPEVQVVQESGRTTETVLQETTVGESIVPSSVVQATAHAFNATLPEAVIVEQTASPVSALQVPPLPPARAVEPKNWAYMTLREANQHYHKASVVVGEQLRLWGNEDYYNHFLAEDMRTMPSSKFKELARDVRTKYGRNLRHDARFDILFENLTHAIAGRKEVSSRYSADPDSESESENDGHLLFYQTLLRVEDILTQNALPSRWL